MTRQAGFSLIEVLIVVVIISILAGLMVPKMVDFMDEADIDNAEMQMDVFLRRVRQESVRRQVEVCFNLNLTEDSVDRAWVDGDGDGTYDAGEEDLAYGAFDLPGDVRLSTSTEGATGSKVICYKPRGTVSTTGTTIQIGYDPYVVGNYANWRSWTFQDVSGLYRGYPCGRNTPFADNQC